MKIEIDERDIVDRMSVREIWNTLVDDERMSALVLLELKDSLEYTVGEEEAELREAILKVMEFYHSPRNVELGLEGVHVSAHR